MGKVKLGDFIRKIDYRKAKDASDYKDSNDNPSNQLLDVEHQCKEMTFEEFKDAFAAFEEKICVPGFPERGSPARDVAYSAINVLTRRASSLDDGDEKMAAKLFDVMFHALVALIKAGPGSTHAELMESIRKHRGPNVEEYVKTLGQTELRSVMNAAKVSFKYPVTEFVEESAYARCQCDELELFFCMFSTEQCQLVQKEFLDTYIHYHRQIPGLSKEYGLQVYYLVRGMAKNFEKENPYLKLNDVNIMKNHLTVLKDMLLVEGYTKSNPTDDAAEMTLKKIVKALVADGCLDDIFDHLIAVLVELHKNGNFRKEGDNIYGVYSLTLFRDMKQSAPSARMYQVCVKLGFEFVSQGELSSGPEKVLRYAMESVIQKAKSLSPEDIKLTLHMVSAVVGSGRQGLVSQSEKTLEYLKKIKALDWKKHIEEARHILDTVSKLPKEKIQDDKENSLSKTMAAYQSFMRTFREQLKKNKALQQLQSSLVDLIFNCLVIGAPAKAELAEGASERDFMNFTKEEKLRLVVLKKGEELLKLDLPWEDAYMSRALANILRAVVDSYDGNGKKVKEEENKLFMSIFKIVSEGGESVLEHFYEEEHDDRPNYRMKIWRDVLHEYVRMHQETATLSYIAPIMPEVLRWAKISLEDDHDDMMHLCYGILNWVGLSTPVEFKTCLPELMDLMLESDRYSELYSMVSALYPHNPEAVHDRLQDLFDKIDDLNGSERHMVTAFIQTVATKHPEAFTQRQISKLLEMYRNNAASQPLLLIIIRSIGEKHPQNLVDFLPQLCDDKVFKPDSMNLRSSVLSCIGSVNEKLGEKVLDYMMKYVDYSDPTISHIVTGSVSTMVRNHVEHMQKYKPKFVKLEKNSTIPQVRDLAHDIILVLEGKSVENIAEDVEQQKEDLADLDTKVDVTIGTVISIGDKVIEHDKEIGELGEGLEKIEERVDDVEEDVGETKIKVEEIDNKTMTNAPKWSRDLTKLMNPVAENDWRLLASRLGYSNDDIRGWATQHDPCMALLSEWYATHKTSEASFAVLTALIEMNRMDGAAIVENAMKSAEGVVEDEEFEYPSPPPVFISYQWGFQNEVKLLKQHLNMAGYECWMDVGQMGGGDKLFAKIDNGIRAAKVVICCVTEKYAQSPNCNREVNLSVNLNKPIIPLLMEKTDWPPKGSMGPIFSEYLFIRFFQRGGEETPENDQRYWPIPKFQELLMQLNFYIVPDEKLVQKEYNRWWAPMIEEIVIDKNRGKQKESSQKPKEKSSKVMKSEEAPIVFLSYQWGKQPQIKALYQRLTSLGYTVWMDIYQMGGGDSLYDKIDRGMRGCKVVVSCVTQKYSLSANCRREISLADALKKPIIPLLLEQMKWPPDGPMSMVFTELLYVNFHRDESIQMVWKGDQFDELMVKLSQFVSVKASDSSKYNNKTDQSSASGKESTQKITPGADTEKNNASRTENKEKIAPKGIGNETVKKDTNIESKPKVAMQGTAVKTSEKGNDAKNKSKGKVDEIGTTVGMTEKGQGLKAGGKEKDINRGTKVKATDIESSKITASKQKLVIVKAFGGSIVKDKIAQDIAQGKTSTNTSNRRKAAGNERKEMAENNSSTAKKKADNESLSDKTSESMNNDEESTKTGYRAPSSAEDKTEDKVITGTAISGSETTNKTNGDGGKGRSSNMSGDTEQLPRATAQKPIQDKQKPSNENSNENKSKSCNIL